MMLFPIMKIFEHTDTDDITKTIADEAARRGWSRASVKKLLENE